MQLQFFVTLTFSFSFTFIFAVAYAGYFMYTSLVANGSKFGRLEAQRYSSGRRAHRHVYLSLGGNHHGCEVNCCCVEFVNHHLVSPTVRCRLLCHVECRVHRRRCRLFCNLPLCVAHHRREVNRCFAEFVDHHFVQPRAHALVFNSSRVSRPKHWKCGSGVDRCEVFVHRRPLLLLSAIFAISF